MNIHGFCSNLQSRGTISFINGNSYEYEFPAYIIRVNRINADIVRVSFQNLQRIDIPVPSQTFHHDLQTNEIYNDFNGSFFVTWNGRHEIITNGVAIIQFNNQRQVSVMSHCEHWAMRDGVGRLLHQDGKRIGANSRDPLLVVQANEIDPKEEEHQIKLL